MLDIPRCRWRPLRWFRSTSGVTWSVRVNLWASFAPCQFAGTAMKAVKTLRLESDSLCWDLGWRQLYGLTFGANRTSMNHPTTSILARLGMIRWLGYVRIGVFCFFCQWDWNHFHIAEKLLSYGMDVFVYRTSIYMTQTRAIRGKNRTNTNSTLIWLSHSITDICI